MILVVYKLLCCQQIEEGEEKKDEPEKIKEGSADGSGSGEIVADATEIEEPKPEVTEVGSFVDVVTMD